MKTVQKPAIVYFLAVIIDWIAFELYFEKVFDLNIVRLEVR
jgi:hypothetical protein